MGTQVIHDRVHPLSRARDPGLNGVEEVDPMGAAPTRIGMREGLSRRGTKRTEDVAFGAPTIIDLLPGALGRSRPALHQGTTGITLRTDRAHFVQADHTAARRRRGVEGFDLPLFLDRQSWLARLLFQGGQVGIRVAAEAGAQGPGMPPVVETLAEFDPSLPADPTQLARGGWAQPRRRGRDQAHLTTEHGGRGGRLAPAGPALVVALRAEQMLEVVVGAWQAGHRATMEQPGFVAAGHLAEVPDGVGERPRLSAVMVHGGDEPVEAAPDKAGVLLAPVVQDVRGPVHPAVGARDVRP